jgi:hypothetical protein
MTDYLAVKLDVLPVKVHIVHVNTYTILMQILVVERDNQSPYFFFAFTHIIPPFQA